MIKNRYFYNLTAQNNLILGEKVGKYARESLIEEIKKVSEPAVFVLNFSFIKNMDFCSIENFLCKIMKDINNKKYGERYIVLKDLNKTLFKNISMAFTYYKLNGISINSKNQEISIIGNISDVLREIIIFFKNKDTFSCQDLKASGLRLIANRGGDTTSLLRKKGLVRISAKTINKKKAFRYYKYEVIK